VRFSAQGTERKALGVGLQPQKCGELHDHLTLGCSVPPMLENVPILDRRRIALILFDATGDFLPGKMQPFEDISE